MSAYECMIVSLHLAVAIIVGSCGAFIIERLKLDERLILLMCFVFSPFMIKLFS